MKIKAVIAAIGNKRPASCGASCIALSSEGLQVPQVITDQQSPSADNRSLAWLGLGLATCPDAEAQDAAAQLAAALWALRRKDGTPRHP